MILPRFFISRSERPLKRSATQKRIGVPQCETGDTSPWISFHGGRPLQSPDSNGLLPSLGRCTNERSISIAKVFVDICFSLSLVFLPVRNTGNNPRRDSTSLPAGEG